MDRRSIIKSLLVAATITVTGFGWRDPERPIEKPTPNWTVVTWDHPDAGALADINSFIREMRRRDQGSGVWL